MTHDAYSTKRVTVWPQEKDGVEGYAIKYRDGYLSWCPAEVYERDYNAVVGGEMTFGEAIEALQLGKRVCRQGWNGKGMWLKLIRGHDVQIHNNGFGPINEHDHDWQDRVPEIAPWIGMKTAGNQFVPWLASQTDMLADDWEEVA